MLAFPQLHSAADAVYMLPFFMVAIQGCNRSKAAIGKQEHSLGESFKSSVSLLLGLPGLTQTENIHCGRAIV